MSRVANEKDVGGEKSVGKKVARKKCHSGSACQDPANRLRVSLFETTLFQLSRIETLQNNKKTLKKIYRLSSIGGRGGSWACGGTRPHEMQGLGGQFV